MEISLKQKYGRLFVLSAVLIGYYCILAQFFGNIPLWDSRFFYELFTISAQESPFDPLRYSGNHNGQAWFFLSGLPNLFFSRDFYWFHAWTALISVSSVWVFYLIISELLADKLSFTERLFTTVLFAIHPSVLSTQVHVTIDTGMLAFWLWYCYALLKNRPIFATIAGCCLLFSKENAMAHIVVVFAFCALYQPSKERMQWIRKHVISLIIPFTCMAIFLFYKVAIRGDTFFYLGFLQEKSEYIHIWPDKSLINFLLMALVLNFNWLIFLVILLLLVRLYCCPSVAYELHDKRKLIAILWLLAGTGGIVIGVRHWANVRYLIPLFPCIFILVAYLIPTIPKPLRFMAMGLLLALFGIQNVRTIDPLSKKSFCHTTFGDHRVLSVPTELVCAPHPYEYKMLSNQLAYNLEFTHIPELINQIMKDIRPTNDTVFMVDAWFNRDVLTGLVDNEHIWLDENYKQTLIRPVYAPRVYSIDSMGSVAISFPPENLPQKLFYIEFPTQENPDYRKFLARHYNHIKETVYDSDGYKLTVLKCKNKP